MAVKHKTGLDYFSFDVDFFSDEKIEFVSARFGMKGELIAIKLLCKIYRNGYYSDWSDDDAIMFAKRVGDGVTPALVNDVVEELAKRDFFDKDILRRFKVLTSSGIQNRYFDAVERRKLVEVDKNFLLIDVGKYENVNIVGQNVNIVGENDSSGKQSKEKVKETKVKESNGSASAPDPKELELKKKQTAFYESLKPYLSEYDKKLLRAFFDYWSEPNKSKTKLRWELQKTWDMKKRLDRWRNNDDKFSKNEKNDQPPPKSLSPKSFEQQVDYMFGRWSEGQFDDRLITIDFYYKMETRSFIPVGKYREFEGSQEEQMKHAVIDYFMKRSKTTVRA